MISFIIFIRQFCVLRFYEIPLLEWPNYSSFCLFLFHSISVFSLLMVQINYNCNYDDDKPNKQAIIMICFPIRTTEKISLSPKRTTYAHIEAKSPQSRAVATANWATQIHTHEKKWNFVYYFCYCPLFFMYIDRYGRITHICVPYIHIFCFFQLSPI